MGNERELNDSLDGLFNDGKEIRPATEQKDRSEPIVDRKAPVHMPAPETLQGGFTEKCKHCGGTGRFVARMGRAFGTPWSGPCFKCKGKGEINYKTDPEARANGRARSAVKRAEKAADRAAWHEAHKDLIRWMEAEADRYRTGKTTFSFIHNMCEAIAEFGSLTDAQLEAVLKCKAGSDERKAAWKAESAARMAAAPAVNANKLEEAFEKARQHAERPGQLGVWVKPLHLKSGEHALTFRPGSADSKWAGMIFVKAGDKKLGSIKDGKFRAYRECGPDEEAAVIDCCNDPAKAAVAYGKAFGVCSICHRTLTNDESIARGIGPICAEKFGW